MSGASNQLVAIQLCRFEPKKKKGKFLWVCGNKDHPLRSNDDGKPGVAFGDKHTG